MAAESRLIRIYGENRDGQWSLINLEFSLAAQADSFDEARTLLEEQVRQYLHDALKGRDREHAPTFLARRAPAEYWLKFWLRSAAYRIFAHTNPDTKILTETMPLEPAAFK